ncbi:MAG: helix-turn-helix domain-containing protein [Thermomicrobia bacterium]|nr:helix-turn-helix domain-containing protein [Thermomicrobia bacterium]
MAEPSVYSVTEAAMTLGLDRSTILRQIKRGALHARKVGKQWTVSAAEIERYRYVHLGKQGFASPDHPMHGQRR